MFTVPAIIDEIKSAELLLQSRKNVKRLGDSVCSSLVCKIQGLGKSLCCKPGWALCCCQCKPYMANYQLSQQALQAFTSCDEVVPPGVPSLLAYPNSPAELGQAMLKASYGDARSCHAGGSPHQSEKLQYFVTERASSGCPQCFLSVKATRLRATAWPYKLTGSCALLMIFKHGAPDPGCNMKCLQGSQGSKATGVTSQAAVVPASTATPLVPGQAAGTTVPVAAAQPQSTVQLPEAPPKEDESVPKKLGDWDKAAYEALKGKRTRRTAPRKHKAGLSLREKPRAWKRSLLPRQLFLSNPAPAPLLAAQDASGTQEDVKHAGGQSLLGKDSSPEQGGNSGLLWIAVGGLQLCSILWTAVAVKGPARGKKPSCCWVTNLLGKPGTSEVVKKSSKSPCTFLAPMGSWTCNCWFSLQRLMLAWTARALWCVSSSLFQALCFADVALAFLRFSVLLIFQLKTWLP